MLKNSADADQEQSGIGLHYSRTHVAQTLMACLPWLFRTHSLVPKKNPIAADLR